MNGRRPIYLALAGISFASAFPLAWPRNDSTDDQLTLLRDSGGWEYVSVSDSDNGIQTKHTCFDGRPHPQECGGTLSLASTNTFVQDVHIHGRTVHRHGTYELDGNQLSFVDELGTKDGPYNVQIDFKKKSLVLEMPQVRIELELEKQYREDLRKMNKNAQTKQ